MVSDHDKTSPSIAVVSALSVACSMLAVQQQKRLCRQFVIVSAARRGCHTGENAISRTCTYKRIDILTAGFRYYRLRWLHTRRRAGADRVSKQWAYKCVSHEPGGRQTILKASPAPWSSFQPWSITALWPVPNCTGWWQRHIACPSGTVGETPLLIGHSACWLTG